MKLLKLTCLILIFSLVFGCEPIRQSFKVKPFDIEPPKENLTVKNFPYEAIVLIDEDKTKISEYHDFEAGVIYEVDFPTGHLLRQALPVLFDKKFKKVTYSKILPITLPENALIVTTNVDTLNFTEKVNFLSINVYTAFRLYDRDLLEIAIPWLSRGESKLKKPGLFSFIDERDYGITAYQAIYDSLKNASSEIDEIINNSQMSLMKAKQIINKEPSNTTAYKVIANLSLKNGDIAEALAASQMIVQLEPNNQDGHFLLYRAYSAQKKYKEALKSLEKAIALAPKDRRLMPELSNFHLRRGNIDKAKSVINEYLRNNPDDLNASLKLALLYFYEGNYDQAITTSKNALEKLSISGIGITIEKKEDQLAKVKKVLSNSPAEKAGVKPDYQIVEIDGQKTDSMAIDDIVGKLRGQAGTEVKIKLKPPDKEHTQTIELIREKFYADRTASSFLSVIAMSYLEKNQTEKALELIKEAEKISPQDSLLKVARASLYLKEGQYSKTLEEAASVKSNDFALIIQSIALAKLKRPEESINIYGKVKDSPIISEKKREEFLSALRPYIEQIETKAAEYERGGIIALALKEYGKIVNILNPEKSRSIRSRIGRIISNSPELVELRDEARKHFLQAEVLFTNGQFEEALRELDATLHFQPFNPQVYFNRAVIYEKISDYAKAIENLEIYLQLNPNDPKAQTLRDQIHKWRFILEREL